MILKFCRCYELQVMKVYKITASEKNNEKATDFETKAMLYMMNYYSNSSEIKWFVIDFFNDITGINDFQDSCYDVQSKGIKNIGPKELGEYLVTLFKNFVSEFNFVDYILFVEGVCETIKNEITSNVFTFKDLSETIKGKIKGGLIEEAQIKTYIEDKSVINEKTVVEFLDKVTFVVDDKSKVDYIKDAVQLSDQVIVEDKYLLKIFKEIRDKQSAKKNNNVEGELLTSIGCFYKYDKHITKNEIEDLIINRICFNSSFRNLKQVPKSFLKVIEGIDMTICDEEIEKSQDAIFRLLADKNNKVAYWKLFSEIVFNIKKFPKEDVNFIFNHIDRDKIKAVKHLDIISCKFFISLIKESIK